MAGSLKRHIEISLIRSVAFLLFVGSLAVYGAAESPKKNDGIPNLTIAQIRRLSSGESTDGAVVRLRAVVTYRRTGASCFLQDSTGAIFVQRPPDGTPIEPGQIVEVEGTIRPGQYGSYVEERRVRIMGRGKVPDPVQVSFEDLASSANHCRWVEVRGIVRSAGAENNGAFGVKLSMGGGRLHALSWGASPLKPDRLVGAKVRLRGSLGGRFNPQRQLVRPVMYFNDASAITIEEPVPEDPFDVPVRPVSTLRQFVPEAVAGKRAMVRGTATYQQPGRRLFLKDDSGSVLVETQDSVLIEPGDVVEALGFPVMGRFRSYLEDSTFRVVGHDAQPTPERLSLKEAFAGTEDAALVTVDALLVDEVRRENEHTLLLQTDAFVFDALLDTAASRDWGKLPIGGRLRLSGIWLVKDVVERNLKPSPRSFRLLVRSPADLAVVAYPPWWTTERLLGIIGLLLLSMVAGAGWVSALRRRVRKQTGIIRARLRQEAVFEERQRIARDFHDTLQQELVGILMQLDTTSAKLSDSPSVASRSLELARQMIRRCVSEIRSVVWDMHCRPLEEGGLARALTAATKTAGQSGPPVVRVRVNGKARKLPTEVETHLLRIAQEAVSNAVKHADAKSVNVDLDYSADSVRLSVADDGHGFDGGSGVENGHFGLLSMRWRAERIGGRFRLRAAPGEGSRIEVEAPLAAADPAPASVVADS